MHVYITFCLSSHPLMDIEFGFLTLLDQGQDISLRYLYSLIPFIGLPNLLFFFLINLFIYLYLFLAVLGLRFCARAFSSCSERGPLFIAVGGPLTVAASPVTQHRLQTRRLSSCGSRA